MKARTALMVALRATGKTQAEAADAIGWSLLQLNQRMVRGTLRFDDLMRILDALGIDVSLTVRETGEQLRVHEVGHGRRVKGTSNKVKYDTASADALSNNFFEDGINEYNANGQASELYVDDEGRYFIAQYTALEGEKDSIFAVTPDIAKAYIEKYGVELEKEPKRKRRKSK